MTDVIVDPDAARAHAAAYAPAVDLAASLTEDECPTQDAAIDR